MSQVAVIVIKDGKVESRTVGNNTFHSQRGFLVTSADEAVGIEIPLPRGTEGYAPGRYYMAGECFDRDQYGRPCFSRRGLTLLPVAAAAAPSTQPARTGG